MRSITLGRLAAASLWLISQAVAQPEVDTPPGQVPIDDVWCATCHFEQGDQFALSVHYRKGMLLCNDCHGGDPMQADTKLAKAPETGFIGRPSRTQIEMVCGSCHSGPAAFFGRGPHRDPANPDNPTCVTCHQNHSVLDASLVLMDTTCSACHAQEPQAVARGHSIQRQLRAAATRLDSTRVRFDSHLVIDPGLQRSLPLLQSAAAALREADPSTHSLDEDIVGATIASFDAEVGGVHEALDASTASRQQRGWAVVAVWFFVAANVGLLWTKRRRL